MRLRSFNFLVLYVLTESVEKRAMVEGEMIPRDTEK